MKKINELKNTRNIIRDILDRSSCLSWYQEKELKNKLNKIELEIEMIENES